MEQVHDDQVPFVLAGIVVSWDSGPRILYVGSASCMSAPLGWRWHPAWGSNFLSRHNGSRSPGTDQSMPAGRGW